MYKIKLTGMYVDHGLTIDPLETEIEVILNVSAEELEKLKNLHAHTSPDLGDYKLVRLEINNI